MCEKKDRKEPETALLRISIVGTEVYVFAVNDDLM